MSEFAGQGAMRDSALGLVLGAGPVCAVFALLGLFGAYRVDGVNDVGLVLLQPLAVLLLVGVAEEIMFRGIVFRITEQSMGSRWAIIISALVFSLAHLPNEGVTLVGVAALAAYSVMQAAIYMRTRTLWLCITNHIAWNFCVGQIFGTTVSGHETKIGVLRGELHGPSLLTGGQFGVEASVVTLIVIGAAAAFLLRAALKRER